ncbi:MAG: DUF2851 family protein [Chitinophagales bacterium]|nr:DUF2851 family protein [Chitinophagales bacterium]
MQERLLHTIWQYSLYSPTELKTIQGEPITVVHPGRYNTDAGPDFLEAKIKVGNTTLAGHVEIHVRSSDWEKHGHEGDEAYKNIVLHIVHEHDADAGPANTPVLCIAPYVSQDVIAKYEYLSYAKSDLPCANHLADVKDIIKYSWLTRLLAERWEEKLGTWQELLDESAGDWSSLLYWRLAANFGFKVNADAFLALARSLPLNILAKHRENLLQVEALLYGQAGMLENIEDDVYPSALKTEYDYLRKKYKLTPIPAHSWKYMRLRPANFPTIRIAQFAALIHKSVHLFSVIIEKSTVQEIQPLFDVRAGHYWETHYNFGEAAEKDSKKNLGKSSIQNIIINTIAPIKFLYASQQSTEAEQEIALKLLDELPAERNHIIDTWTNNNWPPANASQSQAQIQLYNNYCSKKRCLNCAIGLSIVKS